MHAIIFITGNASMLMIQPFRFSALLPDGKEIIFISFYHCQFLFLSRSLAPLRRFPFFPFFPLLRSPLHLFHLISSVSTLDGFLVNLLCIFGTLEITKGEDCILILMRQLLARAAGGAESALFMFGEMRMQCGESK